MTFDRENLTAASLVGWRNLELVRVKLFSTGEVYQWAVMT